MRRDSYVPDDAACVILRACRSCRPLLRASLGMTDAAPPTNRPEDSPGGGVHAAPSERGSVFAPDGSVAGDVPCPACGYNVRGLKREGNCPECGGAVAVLLGDGWLVQVDEARLHALKRVLSLHRILVVLLCVLVLSAGPITAMFGKDERIGAAICVGAWLGALIGAMRFSLLIIVHQRVCTASRARRVAQVAFGVALAAGAALIAALVAERQFSIPEPLVAWLAGVLVVASLVGLVALQAYVRTLQRARGGPDVSWAVPSYVVLPYVVLLLVVVPVALIAAFSALIVCALIALGGGTVLWLLLAPMSLMVPVCVELERRKRAAPRGKQAASGALYEAT